MINLLLLATLVIVAGSFAIFILIVNFISVIPTLFLTVLFLIILILGIRYFDKSKESNEDNSS